MDPTTNGLSVYEVQALLSKRQMCIFSDDNYKKQGSMMNDDSVSVCEIGLTKQNSRVGLHSCQDLHKNFNTFLKTIACLNPLFLCTSVWPQHIQATLQ